MGQTCTTGCCTAEEAQNEQNFGAGTEIEATSLKVHNVGTGQSTPGIRQSKPEKQMQMTFGQGVQKDGYVYSRNNAPAINQATTLGKTGDYTAASVNNNPQDHRESRKKGSAQGVEQLLLIVRVQARIRGFLQRRKYALMQLATQVQSKYFKRDEAAETLKNDQIFDGDQPITQGIHSYKTGAVYTGEWCGGMRHGLGTMCWPDGAKYEGQWQFNQAFGQGVFFHTDGDTYSGTWVNNKANGNGIYQNIKGARYEGAWKDDQQHGLGLEKWPEGAMFEGQYVKSKKQGHGKYTWMDLSTYDGEWFDNKIDGCGVYKWKDGRSYYGEWCQNDMQGYGHYVYADGVQYHGQYSNDKKEGYGQYDWTDGRRYEGWWHKGKQHGFGIYTDPKRNSRKNGMWEFGKRIKWFDTDDVAIINSRQHDTGAIISLFKEEISALGFVDNSTFEAPKDFAEEIERVSHQVGSIHAEPTQQ